ncbi:MAG: site-2 protease family protein [Defluviitaleaceae bacterium]|nr:site-2 protease family protein [Defluviitaleaceae bacterium]
MLKLLISLIIGIVLGIISGVFLVLMGVESQHLSFLYNFFSSMSVLAFIVSILVFYFIGIIFHELGHLVFGLYTGYRFSSFRISPFILFKEDDRIKFTLSPSIFPGQCLMAPAKNSKEYKFVLYNLGGIIFNAFLSLILFLLLLIAPAGSSLATFFIIGFSINLLLALVNAIPVRALTNDGINLLHALKSKNAARGMHMIFYINSELMDGKRYRDIDEKLFFLEENVDFNNLMIAALTLLESGRLEDLGKYDEFAQCLYKLRYANKLPSLYRLQIKANMLYYYTIYKPNYGKAQKIYTDKKLQKFLKSGQIEFMRVWAAYEFFVTGNQKKGTKLLQIVKKALVRLPNKGQRIMELEYIQKLEVKMKFDIESTIKPIA